MKQELSILVLSGNDLNHDRLSEILTRCLKMPFNLSLGTLNGPFSLKTEFHLLLADMTCTGSSDLRFLEPFLGESPDLSVLVFTDSGNLSGMPEGANLIVWRTKEKTFTESLPEIMPVIAEKALCLLMQREMEAEREMNSMIMNNSRSMLSIINRNYVYEKVNARFCDTHATDNVSVEGQPLTELWGEENFMTNIKPRIDRCLKGETVRYEATFATRGGGSRSYDIVFRPFYSLGNEVDHILAESFDITEFRDTESALREIETEFRKLETNLPVGYVRCNTEGAVLHLNKACHNIFDLPSPPPSGLNIKDLYSDGGLFFLHLKQLEDSHVKLLGITRFRSLTGKELSCRLTGFLTDSGDGRYFDLAIEDITREIYLERRLLQAHRLETVGALAGGIAHDFNNILTTIYGYAELSMEDTGDNPLLHDNLARIISAVARARSLTGQILTFSRQIEQEKVPVKLLPVLKEAISYIRVGAPENIAIIDTTQESDLTVFADPTQLFRVFLNLLSNGVQAMAEKGGSLTVEITDTVEEVPQPGSPEKADDGIVTVSFSDTGTGMDNSVLDRIFEPFFTTRGVGKGTGLGLSVVHGIVSEIGGDIDVVSEVGKGSTINVRLPVSNYGGPSSAGQEAGRRLLFVTGNLFESRMLCLGLEKSGYSIDYAASADDFERYIRKRRNRLDLVVFTDDLPEFPLNDFNAICRTLELKVPILLITESQDWILQESYLNSDSVRQFLIKPVSLREVRNSIETVLTCK